MDDRDPEDRADRGRRENLQPARPLSVVIEAHCAPGANDEAVEAFRREADRMDVGRQASLVQAKAEEGCRNVPFRIVEENLALLALIERGGR
jgi:hypothetical protein